MLNFRNNNGPKWKRQCRMDCRVKPGNDDADKHSRDATAPEFFFTLQEKLASNAREAVSQASLIRREAERREAHHVSEPSSSPATCPSGHAHLSALHRGTHQPPEG
jgi:hypothetical protein